MKFVRNDGVIKIKFEGSEGGNTEWTFVGMNLELQEQQQQQRSMVATAATRTNLSAQHLVDYPDSSNSRKRARKDAVPNYVSNFPRHLYFDVLVQWTPHHAHSSIILNGNAGQSKVPNLNTTHGKDAVPYGNSSISESEPKTAITTQQFLRALELCLEPQQDSVQRQHRRDARTNEARTRACDYYRCILG
ncbi:hypothetical protein K458DRAFT_425627 [Lentithecium fluviatile CBS 122367]|uniref:Uncharacterized protein n=1 Tax=Lentithecium fluviatile CBS 122367 TaxID=1168545 RepID=A0A6G1JML1_9PLEO|nr:hypothetical protein K458DRAFT_425627 [Lentithecium fluviatile CBS 122367]